MIKETECADCITLACMVINKSLKAILDLFLYFEVNSIEKFGEESNDTYWEVEFSSGTLTILFNKQKICNAAFIFLDNVSDIDCYIEFCDKTYPKNTNSDFKGWMFNDCVILVTTEFQECNLLIIQI